MADEDAQAQDDSSWWADDAFSDPMLPAVSFDEPLEWPETPLWADAAASDLPIEPIAMDPDASDADGLSGDLLFPPLSEPVDLLEPRWEETPDGPPEAPVDDDATQLHREPLPETIWAEESTPEESTPEGDAARDAGTVALPTFYAEAERNGRGPTRSLLDLLQGKAAAVALVSLASVGLVAMFLSARNDAPTESSQSRRPTGQIAAQGGPGSVPLTTTTATTAPPPAISLSDLMTAAEAGGPGSADSTATGPGASAAPTAPGRSASPTGSRGPAGAGGGGNSGGGGGGGGSAPAQPAGDTGAGASDPTPVSPAPNSPPANNATGTTRRSTTTTPTSQMLIPTFPSPPDTSRPTITRPSIPDFDRD